MNQNLGLLGRKMGCTQIFTEDGLVERVTVIALGPCTVIRKRTEDRDGYWALVLGFEDRPAKSTTKPEAGPYLKDDSELKKAKVSVKRTLKEFRLPREVVESYEVGQVIGAPDVFATGQHVDVTGTIKGRGFAGVIKKFGFKGSRATHGSHEYFRHGGSVGQNMTPGRTFKGLKMPGHYGNSRTTVQNLRVVDILTDRHLMLVRGAVPGRTRGLVMVRHAAKKPTTSA